MSMKLLLALMGLASSDPTLRADTLTLRSNIEINGQVQYANDAFTITAKYKSDTKTFKFGRKEVQSLEINTRDFNPGEPPISVSTFDPQVARAHDASMDAPTGKGAVSKSDKPVQKKQNGPATSTALGANNALATDDVVWLKDKSKLVGRVTLIDKGRIEIQIGTGNKQIEEQKAVTVLVAQE
jgi:hypothetical protein